MAKGKHVKRNPHAKEIWVSSLFLGFFTFQFVRIFNPRIVSSTMDLKSLIWIAGFTVEWALTIATGASFLSEWLKSRNTTKK
jgi:hypothetical protein